ncbi:MAG: ABC transporter substrate-binding protein [bacterium]|nr:ABC transporter substrate-binding protein [bacterium]
MPKSLIVPVVIVVVLIGGYFVMQKQQPEISELPLKLTVASVDTPGFALFYIAQNKGFFKEENLEITNKSFPRGIDALSNVLKGDSDLALTFETPVVRKIYEGGDLRVLSGMLTATKSVAVVGRKDKNISIPTDLKGKKIGVTKNSSHEFFLYSYLTSQGIRLSDVTIVDGEFKSLAGMLKEGAVDAVASGNPFLYDVKKEFPPEAITVFYSDSYTESALLSGRDDIVKSKKEGIIRFIRALDKAERLYLSNNEEALEAVVGELPTFSEETIRGTWAEYTPTLILNNVLLTLLNREGQWFKDNGLYTTELPNFRNAALPDYLKTVKPDAVTIY